MSDHAGDQQHDSNSSESGIDPQAAAQLLGAVAAELPDRRLRRVARRMEAACLRGKPVESLARGRGPVARLAAVVAFATTTASPQNVIEEYFSIEHQRLYDMDMTASQILYPYILLPLLLAVGMFCHYQVNALEFRRAAENLVAEFEAGGMWEDVGRAPPQYSLWSMPAGVATAAVFVALTPFVLFRHSAVQSHVCERIPLIGDLMALGNRAALCRLAAVVSDTERTLTSILTVLSRAAPTAHLGKDIADWRRAIEQGLTLPEAMERLPAVPASAVPLITFAYHRGDLSGGFRAAGEQLQDRATLMRSIITRSVLLIVLLLTLMMVITVVSNFWHIVTEAINMLAG